MLTSEIAVMERLTYEGRSIVQARSGRRQAWGLLAWDGQQEAWNVLPDGRDVGDALRSGDLDSLPPCWIKIWNTGAYGDMMWDGAMMFSFVSDRFVKALQDAGFVTGYQLLPLEVRPKKGDGFSGYSLLLPDNRDPDVPIRSFPYVNRATSSLDLAEEVLSALAGAGVDALEVEDASLRAAALIAAAEDDLEHG